jgi:hypothetical protein
MGGGNHASPEFPADMAKRAGFTRKRPMSARIRSRDRNPSCRPSPHHPENKSQLTENQMLKSEITPNPGS